MQDYKRIVIIPYKLGSGSAKALRQLLQERLQRHVLMVGKASKTYQPRWTDYVINWGCSKEWEFVTIQDHMGYKISNQRCVNKLEFFKKISQWNHDLDNAAAGDQDYVNIPEWTTDFTEATAWGTTYLARYNLTGHSGQGIKIIEPNDGNTHLLAPLYVQYKKKRHEYRVHIFNSEVIDVTQKKKRKGFENVDTKIRNHQNGWVYCRENIEEPHDLRTQAINAMSAVGLDFGAVDIIWNEKENKCYVLEINSAPGISGTTLEKYVDAFVKDIKK